MRSHWKYGLRIDISSACDVIIWYVLLGVFTGAEFAVGYINPKTGLSGAFVSLHFCSMRWCYIFNCVYYVSGTYGLQLWLDPYNYEHFIWPRLLLYHMWLMMWYTPDCILITVNYKTLFIGLTCFEFLRLRPCTFTHELCVFFSGIRLQYIFIYLTLIS